VQTLLDVLAPDVVLISDGGGVKQAALRPILGRDKVTRWLAAVRPEGMRADLVEINGTPAVRVLLDGVLDSAGTLLVENGQVTGIYWVRNPQKLARLDAVVSLTR
jgi:hypothetical protein